MRGAAELYAELLRLWGPQGWWPLVGRDPMYAPGDFGPRGEAERFEIMAGAVLTQNTNWTGVVAALLRLRALEALEPAALLALDPDALREAVRPCGHFNVKAGYLANLARWRLEFGPGQPSRADLLAVRGVGRETADSILLYAYGQPHFVIDAYTRRVCGALGFGPGGGDYEAWKFFMEERLPREAALFQEFHALFVRHASAHYSRRPWGAADPLPAWWAAGGGAAPPGA